MLGTSNSYMPETFSQGVLPATQRLFDGAPIPPQQSAAPRCATSHAVTGLSTEVQLPSPAGLLSSSMPDHAGRGSAVPPLEMETTLQPGQQLIPELPVVAGGGVPPAPSCTLGQGGPMPVSSEVILAPAQPSLVAPGPDGAAPLPASELSAATPLIMDATLSPAEQLVTELPAVIGGDVRKASCHADNAAVFSAFELKQRTSRETRSSMPNLRAG